MKESIITDKSPQYDQNLYAVGDLGSNSFHLLITRFVDNDFHPVDKVKRKVRLASGLDDNNNLTPETIHRGLDCLTLFAKHLVNIPVNNILIVATATLRIANNSQHFIDSANKILPVNINLLSGEQEAETIYLGATCQQNSHEKQLVLDIGGASTELIVGENCNAKKAISLNLGCVSFTQKYFSCGQLSRHNFSQAINAATDMIQPISTEFLQLGWQSVLGNSGTMQALAELLAYRQQPIVITMDFLEKIKQELIQYKNIKSVDFAGLREDRAAVLASGLAILIALFKCLNISQLQPSNGALREGLLFTLHPTNHSSNAQ